MKSSAATTILDIHVPNIPDQKLQQSWIMLSDCVMEWNCLQHRVPLVWSSSSRYQHLNKWILTFSLLNSNMKESLGNVLSILLVNFKVWFCDCTKKGIKVPGF